MSDAPGEVAIAVGVPDLRLALPGSWGRVDLDSPEAIVSSVRKLVTRLAGRADHAASLRADLRAQLGSLADRAAEGGASEMYFAIEIVPGLPVPVSLTIFWPPNLVTGSLPSRPGTVIELVQDALVSLDDNAGYGDQLVQELAGTMTLRRTKVLVNPATDELPEYSTLIVDYWMAVPGTQRVVLLTFSTTLVELKAQMLELFRATVAVIHWEQAADTSA
jgi:hypothetical protein